jgi:hypothetical protein
LGERGWQPEREGGKADEEGSVEGGVHDDQQQEGSLNNVSDGNWDGREDSSVQRGRLRHRIPLIRDDPVAGFASVYAVRNYEFMQIRFGSQAVLLVGERY